MLKPSIKERQLYGMQYRKEDMNQSTKLLQKWSKVVKSNNFFYHKVGRAITKWWVFSGKSNIVLSIYEKEAFWIGIFYQKNLFSPSIRLFYPVDVFLSLEHYHSSKSMKFFLTHICPWSIFFTISIFKLKKGMFQVSLSRASYGILLLKKFGFRAVDGKRFLELNASSILGTLT